MSKKPDFSIVTRIEIMAPRGWKKAWYKDFDKETADIKFNKSKSIFVISFIKKQPEGFTTEIFKIGIQQEPTTNQMFGSSWDIQDRGRTLKIWDVMTKEEIDAFIEKAKKLENKEVTND
jgi:hypothetical protein